MASSEVPPRPERKRFVSGATCPSCGQVDKMYVLGSGLEAERHCNQCGFKERLQDAIEVDEPDVRPLKLP